MTVSSDFVDFGINGFTGGTNSFKISRFEKLTDWQADWQADVPTGWPTGWPTGLLADWLADWLAGG